MAKAKKPTAATQKRRKPPATAATVQKKRPVFLDALGKTGIVMLAAQASGIDRVTWYRHRKTDAEFAREWDEAMELGTDSLEDEALRRGSRGVNKVVYYQGKEVGTLREYSDTLLMFMLKARRPKKFRDHAHLEHTGPGGGPMQAMTVGMQVSEPKTVEEAAADFAALRERLAA